MDARSDSYKIKRKFGGRQLTDDENGGVPSAFGRFSLGEALLAIFKSALINHFLGGVVLRACELLENGRCKIMEYSGLMKTFGNS